MMLAVDVVAGDTGLNGIEGGVALITGAASGIGRRSAIRFGREGADVTVADIDANAGRETAELIADHNVDVEFVETDVTSAAAVENLVQTTVDIHGQLDFLHNNAGIEGEQMPTAEQEEQSWDHVVETNMKGVWLCMKHAIPALLESDRGGSIVNTASTAGIRGSANISPYAASKHGVVGATRTAAKEYGPEGLRVNAVCPGPVDTPMVRRYTKEGETLPEEIISDVPLGRFADPAEIASAVVWLSSDDASYVNGHHLPVDGGRLS